MQLEPRLQTLLDRLNIGVFRSTLDGRLLEANPAYLRLLGLDSLPQARALNLRDIYFRPEDRDQLMIRLKQNGRLHEQEVRLRRLDGNPIWVSITEMLGTSSDGETVIDGLLQDITARKQAERALQESEEKYRIIIANINEIVYKVDISRDTFAGTVQFVSDEVKNIIGYRAEEFYQDPGLWFQIIHPEDRDALAEVTKKIVTTKKTWTRLYRILHKDTKEYRWMEDRVVPQVDDAGKVVALFGVARDITLRKRAQDELTARVRHQAAIARLGQHALSGAEPETLMDEATALVAETLGVEYSKVLELLPDGKALLLRSGVGWKEGMVGKAVVGAGSDSQAGYTLLASEPVIVENLHEESRFKGPELLLDHDVVSGISVVIHGRDRPFGVLGAHTVQRRAFTQDDVHFMQAIANILAEAIERRRSEDEMRKLFNAMEQTVDSVIITDREGVIEYVNPAFEAITGYSREEALGKTPRILKSGKHEEGFFKELWETILSGAIFSAVFINKKKGGELYYEERTIQPLKDSTGRITHFVSTGRDITEQRKAEKEKEKLQAQLLQAQKMEAIGTLAGGVAHDFNNLLTGIIGYLDLAMSEFDETHPAYSSLRYAQRASMRAANLTRQLLLFSRQQPMEVMPLNLNEIVTAMTEMAQRLIGEHITVSTELDNALWTIQGDSARIEQVVLNLTVNARDAMPQGGELRIKTENVRVDRTYCEAVSYARPGNFVCLSVSDTGEGMDADTARRIFEPFFTTKAPGKGSGLGLSVVYGIVKQHDGWINVYSEPGFGSTFRIYLPALSVPVEICEEEQGSLEDIQGRGERVLVVEDEELVRDLTVRTLREHGYVVSAASNAQEAQQVFEEENGNFDLLFSDAVLPDRTGLQLVDELLSNNPGLHVLLTSGYGNERSQWQQAKERGLGFVQKPYDLVSLLRAVRDVLKNK
jgi:PAS domain S-box-containing protein